MDPPQTIFNCIHGGQLLRAEGFNPPDPPPTNTALTVGLRSLSEVLG